MGRERGRRDRRRGERAKKEEEKNNEEADAGKPRLRQGERLPEPGLGWGCWTLAASGPLPGQNLGQALHPRGSCTINRGLGTDKLPPGLGGTAGGALETPRSPHPWGLDYILQHPLRGYLPDNTDLFFKLKRSDLYEGPTAFL